MKNKSLLNIIKAKPYLFWYVKNVDNLSEESIVEAVLNRGDFDDFLKLLDILGMKKTAQIFYKQTALKRKNYSKKTENYFRLFFERHLKHVQRSAEQ